MKPKIVFISNEFPPGPGGIGRHAFELARLLINRYDVTVVTSQNYTSDLDVNQFNAQQSFKIISLPNASLSRFVQIVSCLRKDKPDIVVMTGSQSIWIGSLMKAFFKFKQVTIAHGGELTEVNGIRRNLTHWGFRKSDLVIAVSAYTARYIEKIGVDKSKFVIINNGADNQLFKKDDSQVEKLKATYGLSDKFVLLTVGSVSERKGQDVVIKSLRDVKERIPNIMYVMIGRSNNFEFFKEIAEDSEALPYIKFYGVATQKELLDFYNLSDLFILTSRHSSSGDFEGFGIAVIEAALCGLPAIVSTDSGLMEAIEHNVTGIGVEPDDPKGTATAIIHLFQNYELRHQMGDKAKIRADQSFTWKKVALEYQKQFEKLLSVS